MRENKQKSKLSKKITIIICVVVFFIIIATFGEFEDPETKNTPTKITETITKEKKIISKETVPPETEKVVKSDTYNFDGISFFFTDHVNNDLTGTWKISTIATNKQVTDYAVNYYKKMFSSVDEIHAIVNFSLNTTNSITYLGDNILNVKVYDYVNKEEHDAKLLFSGTLLKEYQINIKTGKIEDI